MWKRKSTAHTSPGARALVMAGRSDTPVRLWRHFTTTRSPPSLRKRWIFLGLTSQPSFLAWTCALRKPRRVCLHSYARSQARRARSGSAAVPPFRGRLREDWTSPTRRQANRSLMWDPLPANSSTTAFPPQLQRVVSSTAGLVSPAVSAFSRLVLLTHRTNCAKGNSLALECELSQHGINITTLGEHPVGVSNCANYLFRQMPLSSFCHDVNCLPSS